jgi:hypothetical protein
MTWKDIVELQWRRCFCVVGKIVIIGMMLQENSNPRRPILYSHIIQHNLFLVGFYIRVAGSMGHENIFDATSPRQSSLVLVKTEGVLRRASPAAGSKTAKNQLYD